MEIKEVTTFRTMALVGRGVLIEVLRKKDAYVVLLLLAIFLVGVAAISLVGIENPSTATFLLNLGLSLAVITSHLLTLILTARQMPAEIENRTLYPLLAQPIERYALLLGKWGAGCLCGAAALFVFFAAAWFSVPHLQVYYEGLLVQALILLPVSLGLVAALALTGSLLVPRGVVIAVAGGLLFFGDNLIQLVQRAAEGSWAQPVASWAVWYLPDFSKLNLVTRYTDGIGPLDAGSFLGLVCYGCLFTAFILYAGAYTFRCRSL